MRRFLVAGLGAMVVSAALAAVISLINAHSGGRPERAVMLAALLCAALVPLPALALYLVRRRAVSPAELALLVLATIVVVLAGIDLYWLGQHVRFPGDFLIWSESEFVKDITKLRIGYPLYTPEVNNESFAYTPGSQVVTWLLASLVGRGDSIATFRAVQLVYVACAALVTVLCVRRLLLLAGHRVPEGWMWGALLLPAAFLVASNATTNPFVQILHNDALALLVAMVAYWLLLEYAATRSLGVLALMALVPAAGFLVKQNGAMWAGLYTGYLLLFDRPRSAPRTIVFGLAAFGGIAVAVGTCYLLWGQPFIYWTFTVLRVLPISPLRSIQHVLDAWIYFAVGMAAGLVLLRGTRFRVLIGPWLVWLGLFGAEAYTSGVAWLLNHLGPGSLIAGVWLFAAATVVWREGVVLAERSEHRSDLERWARPALAVAVGALLLGGLGAVRVPAPPFGRDAYRYVRDIEREFAGLPAQDILLDYGNWIYLRHGIVPKDQAAAFGDRGYGGIGDFSGVLRRLREKRYAKILMRDLEAPDLAYDHYLWPKSSGIRAAILANYHEVGRIRAVHEDNPNRRPRIGFREISILVPNAQ